jgi:hypothetical protein
MKCIRPVVLGSMLVAAPAFASNELVVTAGGGLTSEMAAPGCVDAGEGCPELEASTLLLGAGFARVSDIGVRGSLKLEGAFSFGETRWRQAGILGAAGWQGDWMMVEGGLGTALLWSWNQSGATLGGLLHAGLGVRILRPLAVIARVDAAISDEHQPVFLGLALEWLPLRGLRAGP